MFILLLAPIILLSLVLISIILSSLPLWFASKILGLKRSNITHAIAATLIGGLLASIVSVIVITMLPIPFLAVTLGFLSYIWVVKEIYNVGWGRAIMLWLISVVAAIILISILSFIIVLLFPTAYMHGIPHHWL